MSIFVLLEQQNFTFAIFVEKHAIANPTTLAGTEYMQCASKQASKHWKHFQRKRQSVQTGMTM